MAEPAPRERKKPGRKVETPAQRLERLQRELDATRQAIAEAEQRRLATVGRAVLDEAEGNPDFMNQLRQLLRARVTTKAGKADVASIVGNSSQAGPAAGR